MRKKKQTTYMLVEEISGTVAKQFWVEEKGIILYGDKTKTHIIVPYKSQTK